MRRALTISLATAVVVAGGTVALVAYARYSPDPGSAAPTAPAVVETLAPSSPAVSRTPSPSPRVTPSTSLTPSAQPTTRTPSPTPTSTSTHPPSASATPAPRSVALYRGLGTWVDAYDFSREFGGPLGPSAVDTMATRGVRTLYLQAAKEHEKSPGDLLSPDLLGEWLERAHARGLKVVAWYLPTFVDPARDWTHLTATIGFRSHGQAFDAIGLDIESKDLADVGLRNERLVALSRKLRAAVPDVALQGIVLPPVVTDVIAPDYWPSFPWREIAPLFDVWSPMAYFTRRTPESGWRDAHRYTTENIRLLRADLGRPGAVVHVVGGIGDQTTAADLDGFTRAAREQHAIGGSLYDYFTTASSAWPALRKVPD